MASEAIETMVRQHKPLQDKEIIRIDEVRKELGFYVIVHFKPYKVAKPCKVKNHQFLPGGNAYYFAVCYLVSDNLKAQGVVCSHFHRKPTNQELNQESIRHLRSFPKTFLNDCEEKLEKKFIEAFGAV